MSDPRVFAEQARFRRFEVYGDAVARPVGAGELTLVSVLVSAGQYAILDVIQAVSLNPTTTVLNRLVTGITWRMYVGDIKGGSPKPVSFGLAGGAQDQLWTFTDGTPAGRNILIPPNQKLELRCNFDPATAPATITHVAGAIVGIVFDEKTLTEDQLLALVAKP